MKGVFECVENGDEVEIVQMQTGKAFVEPMSASGHDIMCVVIVQLRNNNYANINRFPGH